MIKLVENGNIFESDAQSIVNPVNCVGVMGAGLAKKFKEFYPDMFVSYKAQCDAGEMAPGIIHTWQTPDERFIFNFPTKIHWRDPSKLSWIHSGTHVLIQTMNELGVHSVAIPALGCGLGGLEWEDVQRTVISTFQKYAPEKDVFLHAPR